MAKEEGIEMEGVVQEVLPDRNYRVLLDNGHTILAYAAGLSRLPYLPFIAIHMAVGAVPTILLTAYGGAIFASPGNLVYLFIATSVAGALSMLAFMHFSGFTFESKAEESTRT